MSRRQRSDGKSPAFQFYVKEFLSDANQAGMSLQETGAYARLMCFEWNEQGKGIPDDPVRCAYMVGATPSQMRKMWPAIRACFRPHTTEAGRLVHPRLEKEREKQATFRRRQSDNGKASAAARAANQTAATGQPEGNHGSTTVQPMSPSTGNHGSTTGQLSDLHTPVSLSGTEHQREKPASLSPPADPFTDAETTRRAGAFIERYQVLYRQHRNGARYALRPMRDYAAAVTLCQTWPDERLDKLAVIFLTTDHKFAEEGSRTIPQFLALASWCDGRLTEYEAKKAKAS